MDDYKVHAKIKTRLYSVRHITVTRYPRADLRFREYCQCQTATARTPDGCRLVPSALRLTWRERLVCIFKAQFTFVFLSRCSSNRCHLPYGEVRRMHSPSLTLPCPQHPCSLYAFRALTYTTSSYLFSSSRLFTFLYRSRIRRAAWRAGLFSIVTTLRL